MPAPDGGRRSPAVEAYLDAVLRRVRFQYDHGDIASELSRHIEDGSEYWRGQGYDPAAAEAEALRRMGEAEALGRALDRQHQPWLGRLWLLLRLCLPVCIVLFIFIGLWPTLYFLFSPLFFAADKPAAASVVYRFDADATIALDTARRHIGEIIYTDTGQLHIYYFDYDTRILPRLGIMLPAEYYDETGRKYYGSGRYNSGYIQRGYRVINDFPADAEKLIISSTAQGHGYHGYEVEIGLPEVSGDE